MEVYTYLKDSGVVTEEDLDSGGFQIFDSLQDMQEWEKNVDHTQAKIDIKEYVAAIASLSFMLVFQNQHN